MIKMHISLPLIFLTVVVNCFLFTNGEVKEISSPAELMSVFSNAVGNAVTAELKLVADLDFSSSGLNLPLGAHMDGSCVEFSGSMNGQGHSIRHLVMDNKGKSGYNHGGLFCNLNDATIENLVIESTCSFSGSTTGAVSVNATGSVTMKNVINKAVVNGTQIVGGLIGSLSKVKNKDVLFAFTECINEGTMSSGDMTGGFVGEIRDNKKVIMKIIDCTNKGNTAGNGRHVGGFVGYIVINQAMTIVTSNSTNKGDLNGNNCGGFYGHLSHNKVTVGIFNSTNNGVVTGNNQHAGGFIGFFENNNDQSGIHIYNCTNNENVLGRETDAAGFVGHINLIGDTHHNTLVIENSVNRGRIQSDSSVACGMACVNLVYTVLPKINSRGSQKYSRGSG